MEVEYTPTPEQIEEQEALMLAEAREEIKEANKYNNHNDELIKFKNFLRIAGEKKSKETGELFREHIPEAVFGISSDEVASDLGISENELMEDLTDGISINSPQAKTIINRSLKCNKAKEIMGIDFTMINPISGREWKTRGIGLIAYGDNIILLGMPYFNGKLKKRLYGDFLTPEEAIRYLWCNQQLHHLLQSKGGD